MENTVKQTGLLEKTGVFDEELKNRYELHLTYNGVKGKRVLVICMNPASDNIQVFDSTTNYLLNNFGMMGYSDITVWNLFSRICTKLKPSEITDNNRNMEYLKELLQSSYDAIVISWGCTFIGNKKVEAAKKEVLELLKPFEKQVYEIVDKEGRYLNLSYTHVLFAGQRFSGAWDLRQVKFSKQGKGKTSVHKTEKK
ncbi:MAG: DUF1643 domain-containing protein [Lachnospiraceae bacterium]|nr:DUF1643 domain-containing protein [Lachnospiraceae bacterium]